MKIKDAYHNISTDSLPDAIDEWAEGKTRREQGLWNAVAALTEVQSNEDQDLLSSMALVQACESMKKTLKAYLEDYNND